MWVSRLGWREYVLFKEKPVVYVVLLDWMYFLVLQAALLEEKDESCVAEADVVSENSRVFDSFTRNIS